MSTSPDPPRPTDAPVPSGERRLVRPDGWRPAAALAITGATFLAYSNSFDASFHLDDLTHIVLNARLRDLRDLWPPSGARWLGYLSFALDFRLGGLDVFGYHLTNVLIHAMNGLLVAWLTATALRTPALRDAEAGPLVRGGLPLAAGLIFAVHPVATQAVTYVVQRFASLATLFYLLSLTLHLRGRLALEREPPARASALGSFCLSAICAAAAMETKEISLTLPFVALGSELLLFRRRRLLPLAPLAAAALLVPLGRAGSAQGLAEALGDVQRLTAETATIPRSVYLLTQVRVLVTYLRLLVLPVRQNLDYDFPLSRSLADPGVLGAAAVLTAVAAAAVLLLVRARRSGRAPGVLVFLGVAWFFVTLSVESSLIPIRDVIFEHRLYLPSVGAAVALATALLSGVERLRLRAALPLQAGCALLLTAGPLAAATYARNRVWKDELTLWSDVVAKSPGKARAHDGLGMSHFGRGELSEAIAEFRAALRLSPGYPNALNNLCAAQLKTGALDEAARACQDAIRLDPALATAHSNLGAAYQAMGRTDEALREYREAIRLLPGLADAHVNLGLALQAKGAPEEAALAFAEAARLRPDDATAHMNLGAARQASGRIDDALREARAAIRLDPTLALAHSNLCTAHQAKGQLDEALRACREAVRLDPALPEGRYALGITYQTMGLLEDAEREYREALRLRPGLAQAHYNLGTLLARLGRTREAMEAYRRAVELAAMPEALLNLALALDEAGRRDEARAQYRAFLEHAAADDPDRAQVARRVAELGRPEAGR